MMERRLLLKRVRAEKGKGSLALGWREEGRKLENGEGGSGSE
jgi:hypothetical protein